MKKIILLPLFLIIGFIHAQSIEGAWKMTQSNGKEVTDTEYIKIYQDDYFAFGAKNKEDNHFIGAGGGPFRVEGQKYMETYDFFTTDPEKVGSNMEYKVELYTNKMVISSKANGTDRVEVWEKLPAGKDALTGNWVITGRKQNDAISRSTPGARRTVKILSGGRFQWIAFNSETKEFSGTGGGTYTAKDGKYIENITFFSRDDSRVGASLDFNFEVIDGEWHHSGMSSTGNPIYEIWTPYAKGYKAAK